MKNVLDGFKKERRHFDKIDYLESQGFEFYEIESKPSKPFGWKKDNIKISYEKLLKHTMSSLKFLVEGVEEIPSTTQNIDLKKEGEKNMSKFTVNCSKIISEWAINNIGDKIDISDILSKAGVEVSGSAMKVVIKKESIRLLEAKGYKVIDNTRTWYITDKQSASASNGVFKYNINDDPELAKKYGKPEEKSPDSTNNIQPTSINVINLDDYLLNTTNSEHVGLMIGNIAGMFPNDILKMKIIIEREIQK